MMHLKFCTTLGTTLMRITDPAYPDYYVYLTRGEALQLLDELPSAIARLNANPPQPQPDSTACSND